MNESAITVYGICDVSNVSINAIYGDRLDIELMMSYRGLLMMSVLCSPYLESQVMIQSAPYKEIKVLCKLES